MLQKRWWRGKKKGDEIERKNLGEKDLIGEKTVSTYRGNGKIILFGVGSGESIIFWEDNIDLVCPGLRLGTERSPRRRPHSRRYSAMWWRLTARRPRTRSLVGITTQNLFGAESIPEMFSVKICFCKYVNLPINEQTSFSNLNLILFSTFVDIILLKQYFTVRYNLQVLILIRIWETGVDNFFCEKPESDPDPEQRFSVPPQEFEVSSDAYYRRLYFVSSSWFRLYQSVRTDGLS